MADLCPIIGEQYSKARIYIPLKLVWYCQRASGTGPSLRQGKKNMTADDNRIVSRISRDEETYIRYGDEMMFRGEYQKALQNYDKAIAYQQDSARAWHAKANALDALGNHTEALTCYDTALKWDPRDAECWFNKGVSLKKIGRNGDGAACIDTGVHIAMGFG
jgi:tetratricopeptide (TPR) repeat protein